MSTLAIGTYIRLKEQDGTPTAYAWQNFHQGTSRTHNGNGYDFAAFAYSGGAIDLESASITATIAMGLSQLSLNVFKEAADNRYLMQVDSVWLDPDNNLTETANYSSDVYTVLGWNHDGSRISVALGSPLLAVGAQTHRRLTSELVGSLPPNGTISIAG